METNDNINPMPPQMSGDVGGQVEQPQMQQPSVADSGIQNEQPQMQEQSLESDTMLEEGGEVIDEPINSGLVLRWGLVFTFFK
jgi:hypothetical protein